MIYSKIVLDHFLAPRNVGRLEPPCFRSEIVSSDCDDRVVLSLSTDGRVITDAKFLATACAVATSSLSVLTEMLKGITIDEAWKIGVERVEQALGGVPLEKRGCVMHSIKALKECLAQCDTGASPVQ